MYVWKGDGNGWGRGGDGNDNGGRCLKDRINVNVYPLGTVVCY